MRDPLFQVIMFFVIVIITALITIALGKIREYLKEKKLSSFFKDFEYIEIENLKLDTSSIQALFLLAKAYKKEGDYEKALKIYLWIYQNSKSTDVLKEIAELYLKAGFLEKAKNIAYQVLEVRPRDKEMLKTLLIIDEKLGNHKESIEIIEIFEELGVDLQKEKANAILNYLQLGKTCDVDFCKGFNNIEDVYKKYPFIKREYIAYLLNSSPQRIEEFKDEIYEFLDLIYKRDIESKFKENGKWKICKNTPFEIKALNYLPQDLADLEFEYICTHCKKTFPLYTKRCPHCNELFSFKLIYRLTEAKKLENIEF